MSRIQFASAIAFVFLGTACATRSGNLGEDEDSVAASAVATTDAARATPDAASEKVSDDDAVCAKDAGPGRRDQVCHQWRCGAREAGPARFDGDAATCKAGDMDADASERALHLVNLHRFLADVPPVVSEPSWSGAAQQCALVAHANAKLSHTPSSDWKCWSPTAALTSSLSLVANRSAPPSIAAYIEDPGNETTMVHRRWLLSEELAYVGFGSTDRYSCVVVDGRPLDLAAGQKVDRRRAASEGYSARGWVAWPPAGPVPMGVFESERLDQVGWTVQSSSDDLDHATVKVTSRGEKLDVKVTRLLQLQGSRSAVSFVPDGWKTQAGRDYTVTIKGEKTIEFTVEATDCE